jgi:hypothetical protein
MRSECIINIVTIATNKLYIDDGSQGSVLVYWWRLPGISPLTSSGGYRVTSQLADVTL